MQGNAGLHPSGARAAQIDALVKKGVKIIRRTGRRRHDRLRVGRTGKGREERRGRGALLAHLVAGSRCEVLLIPVSLFQSIIVAEPGAVQHISRTITGRMKARMSEPAKAVALREAKDPYGLELKGERPEKILVINCGSSSLKYSFYDTADESFQTRGRVERIGLDGTRLVHRGPKGEAKRVLSKGGFAEAVRAMVGELTAKDTGVIGGAGEVSVVAHRVVHGGETFMSGTLIT